MKTNPPITVTYHCLDPKEVEFNTDKNLLPNLTGHYRTNLKDAKAMLSSFVTLHSNNNKIFRVTMVYEVVEE